MIEVCSYTENKSNELSNRYYRNDGEDYYYCFKGIIQNKRVSQWPRGLRLVQLNNRITGLNPVILFGERMFSAAFFCVVLISASRGFAVCRSPVQGILTNV
jgi:hypothetical protein